MSFLEGKAETISPSYIIAGYRGALHSFTYHSSSKGLYF